MLWDSCLKLHFEQLSHSIFCKNIASLAVAMETCVPWLLAKQAIFVQNILWEKYLRLNSKQLPHSMSVANIASFAVIMIIKFQIDFRLILD